MQDAKNSQSIRAKITEHLKSLGESCLRIGSFQDNLMTFFNDNPSSFIDSPTVIESAYSLMNMERSRIRSVLYGLLVMLNMPDEALLLKKFWSEAKTD